jgi:hypothetical protein
LVSEQTFKASLFWIVRKISAPAVFLFLLKNCAVLCLHSYSLFLLQLLPPSGVQIVPAMLQSSQVAFEFSASPLLLQRLLPPLYLPLLSNTSYLTGLGAFKFILKIVFAS